MNFQRFVSIRRILAAVSLLFLLMPIGGIFFLRIFESALIRQTESELISQGLFVTAFYKQNLQKALLQAHQSPADYGLPLIQQTAFLDEKPVLPVLDLVKDPVYPARPLPAFPRIGPDALAQVIGLQMQPALQDAQHRTLSGIKMLDYRGIVLGAGDEQGRSFADIPEFRQARNGETLSLLRQRRMPKNQASPTSISRNATINVFVAIPIVLEHRFVGMVWLNRTPQDILQALYGKRRELFWLFWVLLVATVLIARLTSLTITRPIRALVQKTRLITQGHPDGRQPLANPITREVSELSDNIAKMAQTIQKRTEYLQDFTRHVSHEFKTPLSAIQGSIELLQDTSDPMPAAQQARFLSNILDDSRRMDRLVSRLLELATADMTEFQDPRTDIFTVLRDLQREYTAKNLEITGSQITPAAWLFAAIARESLEAVFRNLLENSRQAGAGCVTIIVEATPTSVILTLQDDGPGITPGNRAEVFTPFFTTRRDSGGTGLGLSIVQSLLAGSEGTIALKPVEFGACFEITVPLANIA